MLFSIVYSFIYGQNSIKKGAILGALGATPIVVLTLQGYMGTASGFFVTENGILAVTAIILLVGALVGLVGAWAKRDRMKAMAEYEKQQKIGKNKNKNKKGDMFYEKELDFLLMKLSLILILHRIICLISLENYIM